MFGCTARWVSVGLEVKTLKSHLCLPSIFSKIHAVAQSAAGLGGFGQGPDTWLSYSSARFLETRTAQDITGSPSAGFIPLVLDKTREGWGIAREALVGACSQSSLACSRGINIVVVVMMKTAVCVCGRRAVARRGFCSLREPA